jgi:hypothetical protein
VNPVVNDPVDTPDTVDILATYARVADGTVYLAMENGCEDGFGSHEKEDTIGKPFLGIFRNLPRDE